MAAGVWDPTGLVPHREEEKHGNHGAVSRVCRDQTPPYGRPSKSGFSAMALVTPGAGWLLVMHCGRLGNISDLLPTRCT